MSSNPYISSSQAAPKRLLATALGLALASGAATAADVAADATMGETTVQTPDAADKRRKEDTQELDAVDVQGLVNNTEPASPKYTAPLRDTPQTISVVPQKIMREQNLLSLRDVLSTLPGITFGAGEGGGGYGDSINLRGYSANNDISVDGVRDSAQYTRTDPFNLEQLELTNGANSVYGGAGSLGGSINLVTKRPQGRDRTSATAAIGTDEYRRITVDTDQELVDSIGVRLNAMFHNNDVPGRDVETFERWGIAPSVTFGLGTDTRFSLMFAYQEDDNIPQYGVPYALGAFNDGPLPGVDPSNYYGYANVDRQQIEAGSLTGVFEHEFSENLSVRNLTRYQEVSQLAIVNPPQGTWCIDSGINPWTGAACSGAVGPGEYQPSGPRGTARDSLNEILINQTDFTLNFNTGAARHTLVAGFVVSQEDYSIDTGNALRQANGATPNPTLPEMDIGNPNNIYTGPVNFIRGGGALANGPGGTCVTATLVNCVAPAGGNDNEVSNRAIYAFDRIEIGEHWELNGGVRFEQTEGSGETRYYTAYGFLPSGNGNVLGAQSVGAPAGVLNGIGGSFENEADLFSYRVGVVYQPIENASIYFAYGNSETPSQATVNGSCTALNCNVDPEEGESYELGAKWDANGGRLSLTASIFSNRRSSFRVDSGIPGVQQVLDGSSRVDGVTLGASGLITDDWSVFANYTYLESELEQDVSELSVGGPLDFRAGDPLPNTPENSFSIWTTYELSQIARGFLVGYGVTYQGEYTFSRASSSAALYYTPDYYVHRAMVAYPVTESAVLQLNVSNFFDEEYYERVRSNAGNGWATPGAARQATLSLTYEF
ncbi:MAG TPA: TonB-dependent receptor [Verrucomicrobiae bacterium]|nr:TonB-dependent receptor [Verrucomicrobiae bacterium]